MMPRQFRTSQRTGGDMKFIVQAACLGVAMLAAAMPARADDIKPAIVFDLGGKFDKSFNEGVDNGAKRFTKETGIKYGDFVATNERSSSRRIARFAEHGQDPIIASASPRPTRSPRSPRNSPRRTSTIIDGIADLPNVQSVVFKEQEGSFLVGMLAAMASKTDKVGFVGGMDIPLIRRFACGYEQGVKYADPKIEMLQNMTGTDALGLERSGARRRTRQGPVRARRRRHLRRGRRAPASASIRRRSTTTSSRSASIPTRTTCIPARC